MRLKQKSSAVFSTKFAGCLDKLRDLSTIQVGHEQFRQLLINTELKDVIVAFVAKIDTVDRPTDRQKRQHAKLYIELVDHFGEQLLLQNHYQKYMQSLVKKGVCVDDVIGYLCKGYLSRIHPLENTKNYIIYILTLFKNHSEIHKIIKQIAENISPAILVTLQNDMIELIVEKMNLSRHKAQFIESMMSVVLALQENFTAENILQPILSKNLKSEDWNVRKACVDICYTLLVVKQSLNPLLDELIKQLKYDKIKNVRDSVSNYESLYKHNYGDQKLSRTQMHSQKTVRSIPRTTKSILRQRQLQKVEDQNFQSSSKTLGKETESKTPGKIRNQRFFNNAKETNIIKVNENFSDNLKTIHLNKGLSEEEVAIQKLKSNRLTHLSQSPPLKMNNKKILKPSLLVPQQGANKNQKNYILSPKFNLNFQRLKSESNDKNKQHSNQSYLEELNHKISKEQKILSNGIQQQHTGNMLNSISEDSNGRRQYLPINKSQLKNYNQKQNLKFTNAEKSEKKNFKIITNESQYFLEQNNSDLSTPSLKVDFSKNFPIQQNISTQKLSNSLNSNLGLQNGSSDLIQIRMMLNRFEQKFMSRLDKIEARITNLQNSQLKLSFGRETQPASQQKQKVLENLSDSAIQFKNDNQQFFEDNNLFKKSVNKSNSEFCESSLFFNENESQRSLESNLLEKVNEALKSQNIDQAYSLVLTNNKTSLLLKLLQSLHIPKDKTVEECLLLEIKKLVSKKQVMKWLKNYLIERMDYIKSLSSVPLQKMLFKIRTELLKQSKTKQKDYELLKTMVLNQMLEIFQEVNQ